MTGELLTQVAPSVARVVFLVDTTARMAPHFKHTTETQIDPLLQHLRTRQFELPDKTTGSHPDVRYALVTFGGGSPYSMSRLHSTVFTRDPIRFLDTLHSLQFEGGVDDVNFLLDGLATVPHVLGQSTRETRYCILISNSIPVGDRSTLGSDMRDVLEAFRSAGVHFSVISPRPLEPLRELFSSVSDSSNASDVSVAQNWNGLALLSGINWDGKPLPVAAQPAPSAPSAALHQQQQQQHQMQGAGRPPAPAQVPAASVPGRAAAMPAAQPVYDAQEPNNKRPRMDSSSMVMPAGYAAAAAASMRPMSALANAGQVQAGGAPNPATLIQGRPQQPMQMQQVPGRGMQPGGRPPMQGANAQQPNLMLANQMQQQQQRGMQPGVPQLTPQQIQALQTQQAQIQQQRMALQQQQQRGYTAPQQQHGQPHHQQVPQQQQQVQPNMHQYAQQMRPAAGVPQPQPGSVAADPNRPRPRPSDAPFTPRWQGMLRFEGECAADLNRYIAGTVAIPVTAFVSQQANVQRINAALEALPNDVVFSRVIARSSLAGRAHTFAQFYLKPRDHNDDAVFRTLMDRISGTAVYTGVTRSPLVEVVLAINTNGGNNVLQLLVLFPGMTSKVAGAPQMSQPTLGHV